jgi:hypothetical protein
MLERKNAKLQKLNDIIQKMNGEIKNEKENENDNENERNEPNDLFKTQSRSRNLI